MEISEMVADTSIFIEYLRAKKKENTILQNLPNNTELCISTITMYELFMGAKNQEKWTEVYKLIEDLVTFRFDHKVAILSAKIYHQLRKDNKMIEFRDIFIATTAIHNKLPLLTLNKKDFSRIKNLKIVQLGH